MGRAESDSNFVFLIVFGLKPAHFPQSAAMAAGDLRLILQARGQATGVGIRVAIFRGSQALSDFVNVMEEPKDKLFRILIVDDDVDVRELLAEMLQAPQRSVAMRESGRAALEYLQHNPVDLAFVDLKMPGIGGEELAQNIKELNPRAHVVICTGYITEACAAEARAINVDRILRKPMNLGEVLQLADSYKTE